MTNFDDYVVLKFSDLFIAHEYSDSVWFKFSEKVSLWIPREHIGGINYTDNNVSVRTCFVEKNELDVFK